jgi:hypothetical protein
MWLGWLLISLKLNGFDRFEYVQDQKDKGLSLKQIAPRLGVTYGSLRVWLSNNKGKFSETYCHQSIQPVEVTKSETLSLEHLKAFEPRIDTRDMSWYDWARKFLGITLLP